MQTFHMKASGVIKTLNSKIIHDQLQKDSARLFPAIVLILQSSDYSQTSMLRSILSVQNESLLFLTIN